MNSSASTECAISTFCNHVPVILIATCSKWATMDIVFLISGSLLKDNKTGSAVKSFLCSLVDSFNLGEDKIQIGLSTLDTRTVHIAFHLKTSRQLEDIKTRIQTLSPPSNWTMANNKFLVFDLFSEAVGGRYGKGVPQIVYITEENDPLQHPPEALLKHQITVNRIQYISETKKWTMDGNIMKMHKKSSDKLQAIFQKFSDLLCDSAELMVPLDKGKLAIAFDLTMTELVM